MTASKSNEPNSSTVSNDLKAEQALGLIGMGLMQKMSGEGSSKWKWLLEDDGGKTDLNALRQRLELIALAIETGAPLSTSEITQLLGAKPGSEKATRGGLTARRISRNVWKLSKVDKDSSYWRN